jgi:hypothetical protein
MAATRTTAAKAAAAKAKAQPVRSEAHQEAARRWNHRDGRKPSAARRGTVPVVEQCPTAGCGLPADGVEASTDPTVWGWIRTEVVGSKEPARLWDSAQCAARGIALAQLRMEANR